MAEFVSLECQYGFGVIKIHSSVFTISVFVLFYVWVNRSECCEVSRFNMNKNVDNDQVDAYSPGVGTYLR